jgi:DNA polymerase
VTDRAHIDFECYSEAGAPKEVGTCKYAEHPSTEVLCLAWAINDERPRVWTPGCDPPTRLFDHVASGGHVFAWNVEFEIPVWRELCYDQMCWPDVPLEQWRDTAATSLSLALPAALDKCGDVLGLEVQKDRRGKHLVNKLCKPRKPTKNDPSTRWTPATAPQDFRDLYAYCARDVEAERAIHDFLPIKELPKEELATWRLTVEMNLRGWTVDSESVDLMLELLDEHRDVALDEVKRLTRGRLTSDGQRDKALEWLAELGVKLPDYQADTIVKALKRKMPRRARRFLEVRQELAKVSTKKYLAMNTRRCDDGTVKNNLLYHGAGTGRDAGRGLQIQNFPRASVSKVDEGVELAFDLLRLDDPIPAIELMHDSVPHFASRMLRSMLTARPGFELFSADFKQVENRIAVWYAGCEYGIKIFEDGLDEYKMFARDFYEVGYDDVTYDQRQHSKHAVLGCVFGMGAKGLVAQAESFGQVTTLRIAKDTVDYYRDRYSEVVEMWYGLNNAAMRTIKTGKESSYGGTRFKVWHDFLRMRLASGRWLSYYSPKIKVLPTPWGERKPQVTHLGINYRTRKKERIKITPGRFFENLVQATARDAMMVGAHATSATGYQLVGRVHDELISERELGEGSLEEYESLMEDQPSWLDGIPIKAEGWRGRRYRK